MKINIIFFKSFNILVIFALILFIFSIITKPYVEKQKDVQYEYASRILDEYLKTNLHKKKCDYMYRDDMSTFIRKKNLSTKTESITGKFVYDIIDENRIIIEWHLNHNKIVIDKIIFPLGSDNVKY